MDSREIDVILRGWLGPLIKYAGVFSANELPRLSYNVKPVVIIANTLNSTADLSTVGHWVIFYLSFHPKKEIVFFDSFGFPPDFYNDEFTKFLGYYSNHRLSSFDQQLQPDSSQKCGLYVIHFTHYVSYHGIEKYKVLFQNRFTSKNLGENDKTVTHYYFKNVIKKSSCSQWKVKQGYRRAITFKECLKYQKGEDLSIVFSISS